MLLLNVCKNTHMDDLDPVQPEEETFEENELSPDGLDLDEEDDEEDEFGSDE